MSRPSRPIEPTGTCRKTCACRSRGVEVSLPQDSRGGIELSVSRNDIYTVVFMNNGRVVAERHAPADDAGRQQPADPHGRAACGCGVRCHTCAAVGRGRPVRAGPPARRAVKSGHLRISSPRTPHLEPLSTWQRRCITAIHESTTLDTKTNHPVRPTLYASRSARWQRPRSSRRHRCGRRSPPR